MGSAAGEWFRSRPKVAARRQKRRQHRWGAVSSPVGRRPTALVAAFLPDGGQVHWLWSLDFLESSFGQSEPSEQSARSPSIAAPALAHGRPPAQRVASCNSLSRARRPAVCWQNLLPELSSSEPGGGGELHATSATMQLRPSAFACLRLSSGPCVAQAQGALSTQLAGGAAAAAADRASKFSAERANSAGQVANKTPLQSSCVNLLLLLLLLLFLLLNILLYLNEPIPSDGRQYGLRRPHLSLQEVALKTITINAVQVTRTSQNERATLGRKVKANRDEINRFYAFASISIILIESRSSSKP